MTEPNASTYYPVRQAIVLIHGIGEQRPMETLRGFVGAFLEPGSYHSKPDTISDSFELRRIKLRRVVGLNPGDSVNADWPETDFYEYYWAHQMTGTRVSHVLSWLWRVICRWLRATGQWSDERYHRRLRWLVPLISLTATLVALGLFVATVVALMGNPTKAHLGVGAAVLIVLWGVLRASLLRTFTDSVGDVARYLDVAPQNVARRYAIIRGGIDMLRKLHEDRDTREGEVMYRYDRIVLIGHSLGSVIAYDILMHYWQEINGRMPANEHDLRAVENFRGRNGEPTFAGAEPYDNAARYREAQRQCWRAINARWLLQRTLPSADAPHPRWLVTDLVTLGSPLTYAPLLVADGLEDLERKIKLREISTCPPDRSRNLRPGHFTVQLSAEANRLNDFLILMQGAYFAVTRWTNFYFTNDLIAGPLAANLGLGIGDHEMDSGQYCPLSAHIGYWRKGRRESQFCRDQLATIFKNQ